MHEVNLGLGWRSLCDIMDGIEMYACMMISFVWHCSRAGV
jgi:hypothetical protein